MFVGLDATARRDDRRTIRLENKRGAMNNLANGEFLAAVEDGLKGFEPVWYAEDALIRFYQCLGQRPASRRAQVLDFLCWSNAGDADVDEFNWAVNKAVTIFRLVPAMERFHHLLHGSVIHWPVWYGNAEFIALANIPRVSKTLERHVSTVDAVSRKLSAEGVFHLREVGVELSIIQPRMNLERGLDCIVFQIGC